MQLTYMVQIYYERKFFWELGLKVVLKRTSIETRNIMEIG
jgi:hypothetical protein